MRIIGGVARGRRLRSLRGRVLRPTSDRIRESLFGSLGERTVGARVADLFAGVGTVGLEALSRGACCAVFVESHVPAARLISLNAEACGFADRVQVMAVPVERALRRLARESRAFDLVFLDPPYESTEQMQKTMELLATLPGLLGESALVICQRPWRADPGERIPAGGGETRCLVRKKQARFGETMLDFYELVSSAPAAAEEEELGDRALRRDI